MSDFKAGDMIGRPKGPWTHVGIVATQDSVVHNSPGEGTRETSLAEFGDGKKIKLLARPDSSAARSVVRRARSQIGQPYRALTNNCETVASRALKGVGRSGQVLLTLFFIVVVGSAVVAGTRRRA